VPPQLAAAGDAAATYWYKNVKKSFSDIFDMCRKRISKKKKNSGI